MKTLSLICCLGLSLAVVTGCKSPGPPFDPYAAATTGSPDEELDLELPHAAHPDPGLLKMPDDFFTLGPGDQLEIELLDDPESVALTTVGPDGKIYFNLLPGLDVWGLTLAQTRDLLEREYSNFVRERPQIGVTLREVASKRIWLLGRVQAPGVYPITHPMTVLEALSLAGGTLTHRETNITLAENTEELADLERSFIIRNGEILPVNFARLIKDGDIRYNIYVRPDDFIYVPASTSREIHVMGAVGYPRLVPYQEGLTLAGAIAYASGTLRDAYLGQVAIVRGSTTDPKIAIVDFNRIRNGKAPDIELESRDIVYVPYAPYRHLRRYMDLIMNTFVTSVAINEGARAVLREPPPPTGILIPFGSSISIAPAAVGP